MAVAESAITTLPDGRRQLRIAPTLWPKQWRAMQVLGLIPGGPCDGGPYVEQLLYGGAAGGGKLLPLHTPIATPRGFVTMGDLTPGDLVYGRDGRAVLVEDVSAVERVMGWRLTFDDGETLTAHDDHLWLTYTAADLSAIMRRDPAWRKRRQSKRPSRIGGRKSERFSASIATRNTKRGAETALPPPTGDVRTTAEIVATLRLKSGRVNHAISVAGQIELPERDLPLDPYLLGVWLGDGSTHDCAVTTMDPEIPAAFEVAGYPIEKVTTKPDNRASTYRFGGLRRALREIEVLDNKHVPHAYLWSSVAQRESLLAGLLDTDGGVERGSVGFTNTRRHLVEAVAFLARSLGHKVTLREKRATLYGKDCGPCWVVKFAANRPLFRLPRKLAAQKIATRQTTRYRYIVKAERTDYEAMRCIRVSAPDGLFLAGESFIPTHNSRALREIAYAICFLWPGAEVRLARRTYPELEEYIIPKCLDELPKEVATYNSTQHEFKFVNGSRLRFLHAQRDEDVQQYKTAEWAALLIDQAEDFTEYQLRFLSHRVRQPRDAFGGKWHRTIVFSANPGGVAHGYLKAQFVDLAREKVYLSPESEGGYRRYFLPAFLKDNPSLDPDEYRRTLSGLPEHLVKAYLTGDWSVVLGAYFSQFSSRDLNGEKWHVWSLAEAKAHYGISEDDPFPPPDWLRWAGIDGGINDPWCVEWLTRAPNRRVFVYRETYGRGVQIPDQARTIKRIAADNGERITRLLADPAMFANRANLSVSDFQIYAAEGVPLTRGNNKREQGWRRVGELLDRKLDDGYPALVLIDGAAPQLQRTLPLLLIDELRREDVSQVHGRMDPASENSVRDDPGDSLRYAITPTALPDPTRQGTPLDTRYPIGTFGESNFDRDQLNQTGMTSSF